VHYYLVLLVGVAALAAVAFWTIRQALRSSCPACARDGEDAPLIPVFFGFVWWCPSCGELQERRLPRARLLQRRAARERDEG
jgi:hypothetical protein